MTKHPLALIVNRLKSKRVSSTYRKHLGRKGERIARRYLRRRGYKILQTNYETKFGEIDIICRKKRVVIFVEVKTRFSTRFGEPEASVIYRKQRKIANVAEYYIQRNKLYNLNARFDIISIKLTSRWKRDIRHIKDAFRNKKRFRR
jgi:putative endonuclease